MSMKNKIELTEYFADVETEEEYSGYYYSVGEALTIVILGTICGLSNVIQIHQWAKSQRVAEFLRERFGIQNTPCYYWLLCLLKLIKPKSLNECFNRWVQSLLPNGVKGLTLSFDGKTVRSTGKMKGHKKALHIISAQIAELCISFGQQATDDKSNEISAVRELIELLELEGCTVVADALNCQKDTAKAIIEAKADYLLSVKDNQQGLRENIQDYVQDESLRKTMSNTTSLEKQSGRIEKRSAFATCDIEWLDGREDWAGLACVGAVHTQFTTDKGTSDEWHYYISSRKLSAEELLKLARSEWSVETMHWLLDVHFREDFCRVEDRNVQQNLNMIRKIALNCVRTFKENTKSKQPLSKIMFNCLLDCDNLLPVLQQDFSF